MQDEDGIDVEETRRLLLRAARRLQGLTNSTLASPPPPAVQLQPSGAGPSRREVRNSLFRPSPSASYSYSRSARSSSRRPPPPKKAKPSVWSHDFFCLAHRDDDLVPAPANRIELFNAGLGQRTIKFSGTSSKTVHDEILNIFPKIKPAGGYELLRSRAGKSKELMIIPCPPRGHDVEYLKNAALSAKIYIRPLQCDIAVEPEVCSNSDEVS